MLGESKTAVMGTAQLMGQGEAGWGSVGGAWVLILLALLSSAIP